MKKSITLITMGTISAFWLVGCAGTNSKQVKVNVPHVLALQQPLPTVKKQTKTPLELEVGKKEAVSVPFLKAGVGMGQVNLGPSMANVKLGRDNGVKLGKWSLTQSIPSARLGLDVNRKKLFACSFKDGISLTIPLVKLHIPCPNFSSE